MDGWTDGWMDAWMDAWIDIFLRRKIWKTKFSVVLSCVQEANQEMKDRFQKKKKGTSHTAHKNEVFH